MFKLNPVTETVSVAHFSSVMNCIQITTIISDFTLDEWINGHLLRFIASHYPDQQLPFGR
jgi:hypothetical protein